MLPSEIGERAEAAVLAALVQAGHHVLLPFGEQRRYDLAYEDEGRLVRVQCKSGSVRKGAVCFRTHTVGRSSIRDYRGDIDYFGVYCHDRREVYLVPVEDVPLRRGSLRVLRSATAKVLKFATRPTTSSGRRCRDLATRILTIIDICPQDARVAFTELQLPVLCCAPLDASTVSDEEAAATADLFKALADPHRVRIVNLLANAGEPVCVCDITDAIGLSQPTVSFHLKKLAESGLLDREKRSTWAYYSLNREAIARLGDVVKMKGKAS